MSNILRTDFAQGMQTREKQDEERLRSLIATNPLSFDTWLELIKQVEKYKDLSKTRSVYEDFLSEFPQYYPVWRKLADISSEVAQTYEKALEYLPVSSDLWLHYCIWSTGSCEVASTRELFSRAIEACGQSYTSTLLWDKFLDFEKTQKNFEGMSSIFESLMRTPTSKLYEYFNRYKNFLAQNFREKKLDSVILDYEQTVIENNKRKAFEQAIKRSSFLGKPLDSAQLENWRHYLDFEEQEGNTERTLLLYQRCLVPACHYPEFWVRFANYKKKIQGVEAARAVYAWANSHFLKRIPGLFIYSGYFEELLGNIDTARELYVRAYTNVKQGELEAVYKHLNLERRIGNLEETERLYQVAFETVEKGSPAQVFWFINYAKFQASSMDNHSKALEVFEKAISDVPNSKALYLAYINELTLKAGNEELVYEVYEKALRNLTAVERIEIWVSYIDFARANKTDNHLELEEQFRKEFHHKDNLIASFTDRAHVVRTKKSEAYEYPEPIKKHHS